MATFTTTLQTSTAYDPFGTIITQSGAKTSLGYQGGYTDPDTGKVNMHARWYQPGTATFTSRDTATLNPSPSVQANRYTYANASPLTGTDPTGHATVIDSGSLAGYGGFGSSGSTTVPQGSYSSSASLGGGGSGQCIGSHIGGCGGGTAEMCNACIGAGSVIVDPTWARYIEVENEKKFWIGQDEIERLGYKVMPNGRPIDQPNFWFADEKVQTAYMEIWTPELTDDQLATSWVISGGLDSFKAMEKATAANPNDPRLAEWRELHGIPMQPGAMKNSAAASRYKYYESYELVVSVARICINTSMLPMKCLAVEELHAGPVSRYNTRRLMLLGSRMTRLGIRGRKAAAVALAISLLMGGCAKQVQEVESSALKEVRNIGTIVWEKRREGMMGDELVATHAFVVNVGGDTESTSLKKAVESLRNQKWIIYLDSSPISVFMDSSNWEASLAVDVFSHSPDSERPEVREAIKEQGLEPGALVSLAVYNSLHP